MVISISIENRVGLMMFFCRLMLMMMSFIRLCEFISVLMFNVVWLFFLVMWVVRQQVLNLVSIEVISMFMVISSSWVELIMFSCVFRFEQVKNIGSSSMMVMGLIFFFSLVMNRLCGMVMLRMKLLKMVWMLMVFMMKVDMQKQISVMFSMVWFIELLSLMWWFSGVSNWWLISSMRVVQMMLLLMVSMVMFGLVLKVVSIRVSMYQEVVLLKVLVVSDSVFRDVLVSFCLLMMWVSIGKVVSVMQVFMKRVVLVVEMFVVNRFGMLSSSGVIRKVMKKGVVMLVVEMFIVLCVLVVKWFRCSVVLIRNMYRFMFSCVLVQRMLCIFLGKMVDCSFGQNRFSSEGLSMMLVIILLIIWGWLRNLWFVQLIMWQVSMMMVSCRKKWMLKFFGEKVWVIVLVVGLCLVNMLLSVVKRLNFMGCLFVLLWVGCCGWWVIMLFLVSLFVCVLFVVYCVSGVLGVYWVGQLCVDVFII